jgi:hypothetical protein
VLDRHERGAEAHDHVLGLGEELVGCARGVVSTRNLDRDLVEGTGVDAGLLQLTQQTIPVRDSRRLDVDVVLRDGAILTGAGRRKRGIVSRDGGRNGA